MELTNKIILKNKQDALTFSQSLDDKRVSHFYVSEIEYFPAMVVYNIEKTSYGENILHYAICYKNDFA